MGMEYTLLYLALIITPVILYNSFKYLGYKTFLISIIFSFFSMLMSMIRKAYVDQWTIFMWGIWGGAISGPIWFSAIKALYTFYRNLFKYLRNKIINK